MLFGHILFACLRWDELRLFVLVGHASKSDPGTEPNFHHYRFLSESLDSIRFSSCTCYINDHRLNFTPQNGWLAIQYLTMGRTTFCKYGWDKGLLCEEQLCTNIVWNEADFVKNNFTLIWLGLGLML